MMKKALALLLTLCLMVTVAAFSAPVQSTGQPSPSEAEAPEVSTKTVAAGETWTVTENTSVDTLTIEDGAVVQSDCPVIVLFEESDCVKNGDTMGQVQFVSDYDEQVAIIHTNDVHGFLDVEPYVKGLKTQLEESGQYSLVLAVNAGDQYAGGYAAAHVYEGEYIPAVMTKVYDAMTWGNNDGALTDKLVRTYLLSLLAEQEGMPSLVSNVVAIGDVDIASYAADFEPAIGAADFAALYPDTLSLNDDGSIDWSALSLPEHNLAVGDAPVDNTLLFKTKNGTMVGLFGETTQASPDEDDTIVISAELDTIPVAQEKADQLRAEGATVVVMLAHTGWTGADSTEVSANDTNSAQVALQTTGIDVIVDGHTHSIINDGKGYLFGDTESSTLVNQANCKGEAIGVMTLYLKDSVCVGKSCVNYTPDEYEAFVTPDPDVQAVVDDCYARLAADGYTSVLTVSDVFLNGERLSSGDAGGGVRANETNLGDLVADGMLWTARQVWDEPVSVSLYSGVRVRSSIAAGDVTMIDVLSVFSSPEVIYYANYTAAELVSALNSSLSKVGQENAPFCQVSGISLTYNSNKKVQTLVVGDELIYDSGSYLVDDGWTVGCVCCDGGGSAEYAEEDVILTDSTAVAWAFRDFLLSGEYTLFPDEIAPDGRIVPTDDYAAQPASASGEASMG